jgi:hypothetical protein
MILMVLGGVVGAIGICALAIFGLRKIKSSKAVNKDA